MLVRGFQPRQNLVSLIQTNKQTNKNNPIQSNKIQLGKAEKKPVMMENMKKF